VREIPVIDIEGFLAGEDMTTAPRAVEAAASSLGFLQIVGHGIPAAPMDAVYDAMARLHALQETLDAADGWRIHSRVEAVLTRLRLGAERNVAELSGGMQKRVALARAIAREPEIIFFDEPTTGLDPIMADVINDLIVKCVSDLGATAVSITHDMASARKIGHRIAMLHEGRLIWQGPVADIDRSGDAHVDQFIHGRAEGPIQMQVRKL